MSVLLHAFVLHGNVAQQYQLYHIIYNSRGVFNYITTEIRKTIMQIKVWIGNYIHKDKITAMQLLIHVLTWTAAEDRTWMSNYIPHKQRMWLLIHVLDR